MAAPLWALVLSENYGLRPTGLLAGTGRPVWSSESGPSLLEQALMRVAGLVPGARTVTVIGPTQRATAAALRESSDPGFVVRQPGNRGTAPGVLLGLAAILDVRPDAQVLLSPANYSLRDADQFRISVREAGAMVRAGLSDAVVFGSRPAGGEAASGWIAPGSAVREGGPRLLRHVDGFVDRPGAEDVAELLRRQAVWNTGVVVAQARALFDLYVAHLPYMVEMLSRVLQAPPARRAARLEEEYRVLRPAEFLRDVLPRADVAVYTWPAAVGYAPAHREPAGRSHVDDRPGLRGRHTRGAAAIASQTDQERLSATSVTSSAALPRHRPSVRTAKPAQRAVSSRP